MNENEEIYRNFVKNFENVMCNLTSGRSYSNIIFLCIGAQRLTGDAFGALVGTRLTNLLRNARKLNVIGTLDNTVSLCNINCVLENIRNNYTNPFIIAIDAALSITDNIGKIFVAEGGVKLGSSLNRQSITIGDMSIRGIVGKNCRNANQNLMVLKNVPLNRVVNLADIVSSGIYNTINYECDE